LEILDADFACEKRLASTFSESEDFAATAGLLDSWFEKLISWQWNC
jgi:hypothetical protein